MNTQNAIKGRKTKIRIILYGFLCLTLAITLRLFYLQIDKGFVFRTLGRKNFLRTEIIPPLRGDVYDCNHVLMAANRPVFDLYWKGLGNRFLSDHDKKNLERIKLIAKIDFLNAQKISAIKRAEQFARRLLLLEDLSFDKLCQICEQCADNNHLLIKNRFKRIYPHNSLASHILGYISREEKVGRSGIESHFQDTLSGEKGYIEHIINSTGKTLAKKVYKTAQSGVDIILTLDFRLQHLAETLFSKEQSGAFILMDPESGALRVMASYPYFDPNKFLEPLSEEKWLKLSENNALLNRATCALYPPASTFKLVTITAGLEEKIIDEDSKINCRGHIRFCGRPYFCMKHAGHGMFTPKQSLAFSCNIPCFHIAQKLKIDQLAVYARAFGLGKKTNFLLPEKTGLVPSMGWKMAAKGERWWKGDTLSISIGQGYLLATPLQIARMVGSICTGYLVKPRIIEQETVETEELAISAHSLDFLQSAMQETVSKGTCRMLRSIPSIKIHAKTGTAQTCSLKKGKRDKHQLEHAWSVGYFQYKDNKPLVFVVLVEHIGSSRFALRIAHRFLNGYKKLMESKT